LERSGRRRNEECYKLVTDTLPSSDPCVLRVTKRDELQAAQVTGKFSARSERRALNSVEGYTGIFGDGKSLKM